MDIQNAQTLNYNTVEIANDSTNKSSDFLENLQILNNSTAASVNIMTPNNITTVLGNAEISSNNTAAIENVLASIDDTAAVGTLQTSNNNLGIVNSPLSFSTDSLGGNFKESTFGDAVFFTDENMDIETEIIIKTE